MSNTFSVIVRNSNSWAQNEDGGNRVYEEVANCGHRHKTEAAAEACMTKLTAWRCNCGARSNSRTRCNSSTGTHSMDSTSALWHHSRVEQN
jgi:hypothetical protein